MTKQSRCRVCGYETTPAPDKPLLCGRIECEKIWAVLEATRELRDYTFSGDLETFGGMTRREKVWSALAEYESTVKKLEER